MELTYDAVAGRIEHSLLGPTLTEPDLEAGCGVAAMYRVAGVCIKPFAVGLAVRALEGTGLSVATTVGFPHGGQAGEVKRFEAARALDDGASEIEMVVNLGRVLGGDWDEVRSEVGIVADEVRRRGGRMTAVFENCYLSPAEIARLCKLCGELGVDAIRTSTGYGSRGASADDLRLMRDAAPPAVRLKAAGGLRTLDQVLAAIALGSDRVCASRTPRILDELGTRLAGAPAGRGSNGTHAP